MLFLYDLRKKRSWAENFNYHKNNPQPFISTLIVKKRQSIILTDFGFFMSMESSRLAGHEDHIGLFV